MKKIYSLFIIVSALSYSASAQLEYKDVAPIFYSRCTSCHHAAQHQPPFMNYSETIQFTSTIKNYLLNGIMPPWPPDTTYSRFLHERFITTSEKTAIVDWINQGALPGDTTLAPPAPVYTPYQLAGTPDLELQMPTFVSNASSSDAYNCFAIPSGLLQDRILKAYEVIPGNVEIVHHVVITVDTTGTVTNDVSGNCFNPSGDFSIGGYAPGSPPSVFPSISPLKVGIRIKAGSKIVLQMHYPSGTAGQVDSTRIRLYFYPIGTTGIRPLQVNTLLQNWTLNIPANTVKTFTATYPTSGGLTSPISVFAAFPHSHMVCTSIVNNAYSGTDTIPLIRINKWDFNLQGYYTFKRMVKVPAGYKLFSSHVFDNTTNNPANPNTPPLKVIAGTSTTDEMLFDSFEYLDYVAGDETLSIDSLLDESIISYANTLPLKSSFYSYAFPNPFSKVVSIGYYLPASGEASVSVYNMTGSRVKTIKDGFEQQGAHSVDWDGRNDEGAQMPEGIYFYCIESAGQSVAGKIFLTR